MLYVIFYIDYNIPLIFLNPASFWFTVGNY